MPFVWKWAGYSAGCVQQEGEIPDSHLIPAAGNPVREFCLTLRLNGNQRMEPPNRSSSPPPKIYLLTRDQPIPPHHTLKPTYSRRSWNSVVTHSLNLTKHSSVLQLTLALLKYNCCLSCFDSMKVKKYIYIYIYIYIYGARGSAVG